MRVTLPNIGRFWIRLMFPPLHERYYGNRISLTGEMPWEPWMHCATWFAMFAVLIGGERDVVPPVDGTDWVWLFFGLVSPPLGFASVWMLAFHYGSVRYVALWMRMVADAGVVLTILLYQLDRFFAHSEHAEVLGWGHGVLANIMLNFSMGFMLVLVKRDLHFILEAEKLAAALYGLTGVASKVDDECR